MNACFTKQSSLATRRSMMPLLISCLFLVLLLGEFTSIGPALVLGDLIVLKTNGTYVSRIAAFGPRIEDIADDDGSPPEERGVLGNLVPVESLVPGNQRGCELVPPTQTRNLTDWIALVERGDCAFVEKVRMMQRSGAKAVVVGDNRWDSLITMFASDDTSDVHIPSIFILQSDYHELRYLATSTDENLHVKLVRDGLVTWPLLDVLVITIITPAIMMIIIYIIWFVRERNERLAELAPRRFVASLPTKSFLLTKRRENDPAECAICLEDFVDDDLLRVLPCRHEFHVACIDPWLTTRKRFCPICKQDICPATERTPLLSLSSDESV